jgi:antitoxin component YwqK of YwqJK toxin-antitoxin module
MYINWKGFTLNAIILASLSLILYGCGSGGSTSEAPAARTVNGVVSDSSGGQPFANASVTAYAIDAAGNATKTPLAADGQGKFVLKNAAGNVVKTPLSASVQSDGQGNFALKIPAAYAGGIMLVATETKGAASIDFTSVLPSVSQGQVVVISPATDMVYQYVVVNKGGSFTADNFQKAILVLEPFFGPNFTQIPPPAIGSTPTPAQQQQRVMIQAINSLVKPGTAIANLVRFTPGTTTIDLGVGTDFTNLTVALNATITGLINQGNLPGSFTLPPIVPLTGEPDLSDKTAPSPPPNLAATATSGSVTLTWGAATDNVGVTAYYVYRNGVFISATSKLTYIDTPVKPATAYTYTVKARDAAGNNSDGSTVDVTTLPILTISGKITSNGSALSSVFVAISGSGSGVAVTDANGNFTFTGLRAGSYTITPTLAGFAFTPVSRPVVVATANITGIDFNAVSLTPGTVTGVVTNPDGSVTTTTAYPDGSVTTSTSYPNGTVTATTTYPNGTVTTTTTYPNGSVTTSITYPNGTVTTSTTYPGGSVTTTTTYPDGTVTTSITYPNGTVTTSTTFSDGTVTGGFIYSTGLITGGVVYPGGSVTGTVTNPNGTVAGAVSDTANTTVFGIILDSAGAPLAGATVVINDGTTQTTITTGFAGSYSFAGVLNKNYSITPSLGTKIFTTGVYVNGTFTSGGSPSVNVISVVANIHGPDFQSN